MGLVSLAISYIQGCPSTLGGSKKSADFFERVAARDKNVRALFTETVIQRLEKEIGCKIKMDEKFLFVSGKDRLILAKGVDAVHKLIQGEGEDRGRSKSPSNAPQKSKSRSPERSPAPPRSVGRETRSSHSNPRNTSYVQRKGFSQERVVEDHVREGSQQKLSRGSPKGRGPHRLCLQLKYKPHGVTSSGHVVNLEPMW